MFTSVLWLHIRTLKTYDTRNMDVFYGQKSARLLKTSLLFSEKHMNRVKSSVNIRRGCHKTYS